MLGEGILHPRLCGVMDLSVASEPGRGTQQRRVLLWAAWEQLSSWDRWVQHLEGSLPVSVRDKLSQDVRVHPTVSLPNTMATTKETDLLFFWVCQID